MQKSIIILTIIISLLGTTLGQCNVKSFDTKLIPECNENDLNIQWPNYEDQSSFYFCFGRGLSKHISCPVGQVFTYALQKCTSCSQYLPPVPCENLPTQMPPICVSINGNGSEIDPPEGTVEIESAEESEGVEESEGTEEPESTIEPEATEQPEVPTRFPGPPSPSPSSTQDPNAPPSIPTPPTAHATPPLSHG